MALNFGDLVTTTDRLPGTDTYFHVTLIDEAVDRFNANQPIGPIAETMNGGRAYLYDTDTTYPQFTYLVSLLVGIIVGSAGKAVGLLILMTVVISQLSFYFGFKPRFGIVGALVGALAFSFAPFTLTNIDPQGRYPTLLAVAALPAIMAGMMALMERPTRIKWVVTVLAVALSVAFHAMVFYVAAIPIGIIAILHAVLNRFPVTRSVLALSVIVVGILVSWIFLPDAISDLSARGGVVGLTANSEGPGVRATTGADSEILPFSIRWNSFNVSLRMTNENYAGIGIAIASMLALVLVRNRQMLIFGIGTLFAYLLATGTLTPLWEQIPLASNLEPRRFLFPAYLGASLMIAAGSATWVHSLRNRGTPRSATLFAVPLIAVITLLAVDSIPMIGRVIPKSDSLSVDSELFWSADVDKAAIDGRLFWNAHRDFSPYYHIGRLSSIDIIGRLGTADSASLDNFRETALAELALYNTRGVLTDNVRFTDLVNALQENGFEEYGRYGTQVLLASDAPGSIFMNQTRDVALVGTAAAAYWPSILPNSIILNNPMTVPDELLSSFNLLVFSSYRIADIEEAEERLLEFVQAGGRIIFEEPNQLGENLFQGESVLRDVPREITINGANGPRELLPFEIDESPFAGYFYDDIGEITLSGTDSNGDVVPLVKKQQVGLGAMYWVCCNLGNHTVINPGRDHILAEEIRDYFDSEVGGFQSIWPTEFDAAVEQTGPSTHNLSYTSTKPIPIVISLRLPHKRKLTTEDGTSIELLPFGKIITAILPAGTHVVTLDADAQPFSIPITTIWLLGLLTAGLILSVGWRPGSKEGPSTFALAVIGIRRYLNPRWAGSVSVDTATIKVQIPRIQSTYESLSTDSGTLQRFSSPDPNAMIAVLFVEISNSDQQTLKIPMSEFRLHLADGRSIPPISDISNHTSEALRSGLLAMLDRRQPRLLGEISMEKTETISGFVLFSTTPEEEITSFSATPNTDQRVEF
ncbi:hypothetical protein JYU04_03420 [Dehalococcoides mccartyi]|nr:hypothetical protein [Dehalococcoides mccartyi]